MVFPLSSAGFDLVRYDVAFERVGALKNRVAHRFDNRRACDRLIQVDGQYVAGVSPLDGKTECDCAHENKPDGYSGNAPQHGLKRFTVCPFKEKLWNIDGQNAQGDR